LFFEQIFEDELAPNKFVGWVAAVGSGWIVFWLVLVKQLHAYAFVLPLNQPATAHAASTKCSLCPNLPPPKQHPPRLAIVRITVEQHCLRILFPTPHSPAQTQRKSCQQKLFSFFRRAKKARKTKNGPKPN
jgi:hypothetical protein